MAKRPKSGIGGGAGEPVNPRTRSASKDKGGDVAGMQPRQITLEELQRRIIDPRVSRRSLGRYFVSDEDGSGPFDPIVRLNPETVAIPTGGEGRRRSDVLLSGANGLARLRRDVEFQARIASGYEGPVIVSEGDSWFQYPFKLEDVIDHLLPTYAIRSLDAAGDTLQNMVDQNEYLRAIAETNASVFLFSGGGNDVLGGGNLKEHLRDYDPALSPEQHLLPSFRDLIDHAIALYDHIFRSVEASNPDIVTLCHGYDRPIPNGGRWLGQPMEGRGIVDKAFQASIAAVMIDRFNAKLKLLADAYARVSYLDLRGVVGPRQSRWDDELHPTNAAFEDVAARFQAEIKRRAKVRPLRSLPRRRRLARVADTETAVAAVRAPAVDRGQRRGLSLNVGLNLIDPGHYGTDAPLVNPEYDAQDMGLVARNADFEVMDTLLGSAATVRAVTDGIALAAKSLKAGDIFLFTYAGHGSQKRDEDGDEDDLADETFCLFDRMLVDDELYELWRAFPDDCRILVISDSCHSGSVVRAALDALGAGQPPVSLASTSASASRLLDRRFAARTFRAHNDLYEGLRVVPPLASRARPRRELDSPLRCSVLLMSGCMDNQESSDGPGANGAFTGKLLSVWDDGRFKGDYTRFHRRIQKGMPPSQTPQISFEGRPNPAFWGQVPFSI